MSAPASPPTITRSAALEHIRAALLALDAAGDDGFEGLMATVLARMTGLVMRLAKSGSQFGRDATTPAGIYGVAMEGKRYGDDLRLEHLAGKIAVATHVLEGLVDLYVIGATSSVGDATQQFLSDMLADKGITLLTLDWTPHPIPPLAVVLAADPLATLTWFDQNVPGVDLTRLGAALDEVRQDPAFATQAESLRDAVSAASVGFEPLRRHGETWLATRLSDAGASQRAFGQRVTVADAAAPPVPRPGSLAALSAAMQAGGDEPRVAAVLADEGMGKTWLVAQWWLGQAPRPLMLFVAGRRVERLDVRDALGSLAALLAEQEDGAASAPAVAAWRQRLERWKLKTLPTQSRIVVTLDGINERQTLPWSDVIGALADEVHALGGVLVVTSRPAFWQADVRPRLRPDLDVVLVPVLGYADPELTAALAPAGVRPDDLPAHVREFVRNPRVCRVAVHELRTRNVVPQELTVERLLLDYWQHRLEERGDLVAHNVVEFHRVLREHARAWLDSPARPFDRTEWTLYVAAARRGVRDVRNDLTEIEEGRFLTVRDGATDTYEFRPEVVPFALGLLITAEVRRTVAEAGGDGAHDALPAARDGLAKMLDPVRGFDVLSDIVTAAVGLACLDPTYPAVGRVALVLHWLTLQNLSDRAEGGIAAALVSMPEPFLTALEQEDAAVASANGTGALAEMLLRMRDDGRLGPVLRGHLPRWLGRWAWRNRTTGRAALDAERRARDQARLETALAALTAEERTFKDRYTIGVESRAAVVDLDRLAALLLAARPLAPHALGLASWAFATTLSADLPPADDELQWVCRFNEHDPASMKAAISALFAAQGAPSEVGRRARALLLRTLGDAESVAEAAVLRPMIPGEAWTRAEQFCDANPYDPASGPPTNLERAREAAASVEPSKVWVARSRTTDDVPLDDALPGLSRFEPERVADVLRRVVATAPEREWEALHALSWRLEELTPLFDDVCVAALEAVADRLLSDATLHEKHSYDWVITAVSAALAPHRSAGAQLAHLLRLPATVKPYTDFAHGLAPVSAESMEEALVQGSDDPLAMERVLLFLIGSESPLTDAARDRIFEALMSPVERTAVMAAEAIWAVRDPALDERVLDAVLRRVPPFAGGGRPVSDEGNDRALDDRHGPEQSYSLKRAVAAAAIRRSRADVLAEVDARFLSAVAARLGPAGDEPLIDVIEGMLSRMLDPGTPDPSSTLALTVETAENELALLLRFETRGGGATRAEQLLQVSGEEADRRLAEEGRAHRAEYDRLVRALDDAGASAMVAPPPRLGLAGLVERHPMRVKQWVDWLLDELPLRTSSRAGHFGYAIASAYSHQDAPLAAELFARIDEAALPVAVRIGHAGVSLRDHTLFSAAEASQWDAMRRARFVDAFDDAALFEATLAAEIAGSHAWLDALVDLLLSSPAPGQVARGITISGFRAGSDHASSVLERDWGSGFLGQAGVHARLAYDRARWTEHWLREAEMAQDGTAFWRATYLAEAVADARAFVSLERIACSGMAKCYHADLPQRFTNASERRARERARTLFGHRVPKQDLVQMLRA